MVKNKSILLSSLPYLRFVLAIALVTFLILTHFDIFLNQYFGVSISGSILLLEAISVIIEMRAKRRKISLLNCLSDIRDGTSTCVKSLQSIKDKDVQKGLAELSYELNPDSFYSEETLEKGEFLLRFDWARRQSNPGSMAIGIIETKSGGTKPWVIIDRLKKRVRPALLSMSKGKIFFFTPFADHKEELLDTLDGIKEESKGKNEGFRVGVSFDLTTENPFGELERKMHGKDSFYIEGPSISQTESAKEGKMVASWGFERYGVISYERSDRKYHPSFENRSALPSENEKKGGGVASLSESDLLTLAMEIGESMKLRIHNARYLHSPLGHILQKIGANSFEAACVKKEGKVIAIAYLYSSIPFAGMLSKDEMGKASFLNSLLNASLLDGLEEKINDMTTKILPMDALDLVLSKMSIDDKGCYLLTLTTGNKKDAIPYILTAISKNALPMQPFSLGPNQLVFLAENKNMTMKIASSLSKVISVEIPSLRNEITFKAYAFPVEIRSLRELQAMERISEPPITGWVAFLDSKSRIRTTREGSKDGTKPLLRP